MDSNRKLRESDFQSTSNRFESSCKTTSAGVFFSEAKVNVFFNADVPISDLKRLGSCENVDQLFVNWSQTQQKYDKWASHNSSPLKNSPVLPSQPLAKYPFPMSPPPGFEQVTPKSYLSDLSTESEMSLKRVSQKSIKFSENEVKLKPIPIKVGWIKREKRGSFTEETISSERHTGVVKFYQLKKRFGFISLDIDGTDIFLCEDDLVISLVNIKVFKEKIYFKNTMRMSFLIKKYFENGVKKRKAIELEMEPAEALQ